MDKTETDGSPDTKDGKVDGPSTSLSQPTIHCENSHSSNVSCNEQPVDSEQNTSESVHEDKIAVKTDTSQLQPRDPEAYSIDNNIDQIIVNEDSLKLFCNEDVLPAVLQDEIRLKTADVVEPAKESETIPSIIAVQNVIVSFASTPLECTSQAPIIYEHITTVSEKHEETIAAKIDTSQLQPRDPEAPSIDNNIDQIIVNEDSLKLFCNEDELPAVLQDEIRLQTTDVVEPAKESETIPSIIAVQNVTLSFASTPLECTSQAPVINEHIATQSEENADSPIVHRHDAPTPSSGIVTTGETCRSPTVPPVMAIDSPRIQQCMNASGLSLLAAQYVSDSDSDDVYEVSATQSYQNRVVEIDSDSSTDVEVTSEDRDLIDLEILNAGHGDEDDEENIRNSRAPKVKGELQFEDLPPIQDLHITVPEDECTELGHIQSIVEQLVLVNSLPGTVPLDLETVLFLDKGKQVLGEIFDVLGQVSDPLYCVRFNSNKSIKEKGIEVGQTVYVAPRTQHTQFIVLANLMKMRGSDASWENDVEPPPRYLDYSDDEEEREARRPPRNRSAPMDTEHEAPKRHRLGGGFQPSRPYRGNYHGPSRQPHYQPPSNYDIAGNSWHSNYYQNYVHPHQQYQHYRMPIHPQNMSVPPPHVANPGMVLNPYAVYPPPPLMQQPLFPPNQAPPPPPPPSGGF